MLHSLLTSEHLVYGLLRAPLLGHFCFEEAHAQRASVVLGSCRGRVQQQPNNKTCLCWIRLLVK